MQLYFYNTEHEIKNRLQYSPKLDKLILSKLLNILQIDPYCSFFRHLKDIPNLEYKKTCIRSDPQLDQRLYNVPSISQVAVIWLGYNSEEHEPRNIIVYSHSGSHYKIKYFYGCYDPLQYPLLFPHGDIVWHERIFRNSKSNLYISQNNNLIDPQKVNSIEDLIPMVCACLLINSSILR